VTNLTEILTNATLNPEAPALNFVDRDAQESYSYGELQNRAARLRGFLAARGIGKGDRVVLVSENRPHWGAVYLSVVSHGAVIVPILTDFTEAQMGNILEHSGAGLVFASEKQQQKVAPFCEQNGVPLILLETLPELYRSGEAAPRTPENNLDDDLAALLYTSGTTGTSKGVMLTHGNLAANIKSCGKVNPLTGEDRFLSLLPLAHTYECTIGFLFPLSHGCSISYIKGAPSPRVLMDAMARIKPTCVLSVPLLIEKIYRQKVAASLYKGPVLPLLMKIPPFRKLLHTVAGKKLHKSFGGELTFFGVGGAGLAPDVERFLKDARFPYSIGYGLTETAPLLAGSPPDLQAYRSTGPAVEGVTLRIADPNPETGVGEIQARGPNIMTGYYKDPGKTAEAFTSDGWFRTGDLGELSRKGYLYIRGRLKNLILGANGENIYPEEVESILVENALVEEALMVQKGKELVGLIYLNAEKLQQEFENQRAHLKVHWEKGKHGVELFRKELDAYKEEILERIRQEVNQQLSPGSRLSKLVEQANPFEKTPSLKIKRYLYA